MNSSLQPYSYYLKIFWEGADGISIKINQPGLHVEGRDEKGKRYNRRGNNENRGSKIKRETLKQSRSNFVIKLERNI